MPVATLRAAGGRPEVEIVVGHLHRADYQFFLYDVQGKNPVLVHEGKTGDPVSDRKAIDTAATVQDLHARTIFWQAGLSSFVSEGATAPFSVVCRLLQDGRVMAVDGGTGTMDRPLTSGKFQVLVS
jgi:hypothetical protein